jgi:hypothetical protein
VRSTLTGFLADVLCGLGESAEARLLSRFTRETAGSTDLLPQVLWRRVDARLLSRDGNHADAVELAREAVRRAATTDYLDFHADTRLALSEVATAAGDAGLTESAITEARQLYERKGNLVAVRKVSELSVRS